MNRNEKIPMHDFKGIGFSKIGHFKEVRRQSVSELVESICSHNGWSRAKVQDRIIQILEMLEERGLIDGQSIC